MLLWNQISTGYRNTNEKKEKPFTLTVRGSTLVVRI